MKEQAEKIAGVAFTVPMVPPSVNHYKVPVVIKRGFITRKSFVVTPEGKAFKQGLGYCARGASISPASLKERTAVRYRLEVKVYLGEGQRGDGDNFWKCIADGLVDAGVIHSDARVRDWWLSVYDTDRKHPRTEIRASVIDLEAEREGK